jgi:hypothetical protein
MSSSIERRAGPGAEGRGRRGRDELRVGRVRFVMGLRSGPDDPWAHRKGEPRVFTLLWAVYLMAGAMMTLFAARSLGSPSARQYQMGSVAMIQIILVGVSLLWPATRLSQSRPRRVIAATWMDLAAVMIPAQAAIWPMPLLARWPLEVSAALAAWTAGWSVLVGAFVARGMAMGAPMGRTAMMGLIILLTMGGPALGLALGWRPVGPGAGAMAWSSPFTGVVALTSGPQNLRLDITATQWAWVAAVWALGAVAWAALAPWVERGPRATAPPPGWATSGARRSGGGRVR